MDLRGTGTVMRHFGGLAAALIILLLVSLCSLRLNDSILLDPDGTEFLLLARSLATFQGYRDISQPGWPPHTLRPPGCSILLLTAAWLAP